MKLSQMTEEQKKILAKKWNREFKKFKKGKESISGLELEEFRSQFLTKHNIEK